MNQLPAIAYKYHETLESFRTFRGVGVRLLAGVIVAGLAFAVLLGWLVLTTAQHRGALHSSMPISGYSGRRFLASLR